ncbi:MAG: hypothetical protein HY332_23400 [Chloroflexi bacterium]|nr:hypothetical protein [Chloroflexota bacterium]
MIADDAGTATHRVREGEHLMVRTSDRTTVFVEAGKTAAVELDGKLVRSIERDGHAFAAVDISTTQLPAQGIRRIEVRERSLLARLDVLTDSAVETLRLLRAYVHSVEGADLPRLAGRFWYLDARRRPRRFVDPFRVATFLADNLDLIEHVVQQIDEQPQLEAVATTRIQPSGYPIDVPATRRLLTRHPEYVQEAPNGPITIGDRRFAPTLMRVSIRRSEIATPEHRRLSAFLRRLWADARRVENSGLASAETCLALSSARQRLDSIRTSTFISRMDEQEFDIHVVDPTPLEAVDDRYALLRRLRVQYLTNVSPGIDAPQLTRQYLARPDEIFQAYCCYVVAAALSLKPIGDGLRDRTQHGVSFTGEEWELYYDIHGVVHSWRDGSSRPDGYRPDILLRNRSGKVILLDAKFSAEGGRPTGERLKEVQAYLNSFGLERAGVLFPSNGKFGEHSDVAGGVYLLREIGIAPIAADADAGLARLRAAVLELACEPHSVNGQ